MSAASPDGGLEPLEAVGPAAEHCSYNPKLCRSVCPVAAATGRESATPWGINREIAAALRRGSVTEATAAAVYACTGCRACALPCQAGLDLPRQVRPARAAVLAAGRAPAGLAAEAGAAVAADPALQAGATPGAATVVYPGCRSEEGPALAALLAAAGCAYDVVAAATCCGARSVDIGDAAGGRAQADDLAERLAGAERVVVADPHCARWLGQDRGDPRVRDAVSWLAEQRDRLRLRGGPAPVLHDACWLDRGLGVHAAPRALLTAAGAAPAELAWGAGCTGGGMGYPAADPAGAEAVLADCVAALPAAPHGVVSACPVAVERLRRAGLAAVGVADWLAGRLAAGEPGAPSAE